MNTWDQYKKTMQVENEALFERARSGDIEFFQSQHFDNMFLNQKNHKGHSLLMLASYNGHIELSRYLISKGADLDSIDLSGNSILMGAAFKGHTEIVKLLIHAGANIKYQNSKNQTALDFAQMFGRSDVVKLIKSYLKKPETYGISDFISGWFSFLKTKGAST